MDSIKAFQETTTAQVGETLGHCDWLLGLGIAWLRATWGSVQALLLILVDLTFCIHLYLSFRRASILG